MIRDRGKMKWQFAFGMPALIKSQRDLWRDTERMAKPLSTSMRLRSLTNGYVSLWKTI
ncbi:hypothetical protein [Neobacillus cucumis]|uniref:hypothetical protein n=1 Tax=Neobacillus cucumis TaxID=1740721 RepID=UPI002E1EBB96|nr:hypothetical protein [Neobacillus cucumis]